MTVLCLAVGVSFASAQTNSVAKVKAQQNQVMAISQNNTVKNTGYKGSIFAKTGELFTTSFSAADQTAGKFTTGQITDSVSISGTMAVTHAQTTYHSTWHRVADTTTATYNSLHSSSYYPATFNPSMIFASLSPIRSNTPMDGFMVMTMEDQISAWGGSGTVGNFDAYIAFQSFATTNAPLIDVSLWQYYRKFNGDKCFIDYSTDNTNWGAVEINVRGIDVNTNSSIRGTVTTTLPAACAHQSNVYLRLRWMSNSNGGGAYGYFWFVDDIAVVPGEANRMTVKDYAYYEGFYQIMPEGLQVPVVSYIDFVNNGTDAQTNIAGKVYSMNDANGEDQFSAAAQVASSNTIASLSFDPTTTKEVRIDPLGLFAGNGWVYVPNGDTAAQGTTGNLPTTLASGVHGFYYGQLASTAKTYTFDTMNYDVSHAGDISTMNGMRLWGRDNGVLRKFAAFTWGLTSDGYITNDVTENGVSTANYSVNVSYTTGATVPENWVIRGVQLVASTQPGYATVGTTIDPTLTYDSLNGDYIYFNTINTGAPTHTVAASEINDPANLTYLTRGNYNVINIQFPNQPTLKAKNTYRIGYQLTAPSTFAVAHSTNVYARLSDTGTVWFDTVSGMHAYKGVQTVPYQKIRVYDPGAQKSANMGSSCGTQIPMIRMIVGPKIYIPSYAVTVSCGSNGEIMDEEFVSKCGEVDSLVQGSTNTFYAQATTDGYELDKVTLDGTVLSNGDGILTVQTDENTGYTYGIIQLANVSAAHTLSATFKNATSSIDPVAANVSMKLQPNPATNNVQLSISGVNGMVNYSLLDMSGRVISSARINAESVNSIDVSKLAKGAYFVRITNDKFSKVEKLIVR